MFEELREAVHQRRTTQQDAIVEGIQLWIAADAAAKPEKPSIRVSDANRAVISFLADLFERKGTPEQEALKASLRAMLGSSKPATRKVG